MSLFIERVYPYLIGLACGVLWHCYEVSIPEGKGVLASSLTLGAILTGFLATAKAIVMSSDSPVMARIRKTGYLKDLVSYLASAVWLCLILSIVSIIGAFLDSSKPIYGLIWIVTLATGIMSFYRVTNIMFKVIGHPGKGEKG